MTGPVAPSHAPATKAARHAQITWILAAPGAPVHSQDELADRLAQVGVRVTQATLSRDLDELGAVRLRGADGALVYALPPEQQEAGPAPAVVSADVVRLLGGLSGSAVTALGKVAADLLLSAQASGNLVVLKTPPGAAQLMASMIDRSGLNTVLGTVAGDDTVLVVARDPAGGNDLAASFLRLAERRVRPDGERRPLAEPGYRQGTGDGT
jgi:transcriptional regulator of arginine metabolism